jgi:hypothetical protein
MSVVVRKSLGRQLRALRLAARKTPSDVQTSGIASTSKLHRVETGAVPIRLETVWALSQLYGADTATRERLSEMARHSNDKGWWEDYSDVMPAWFGTYVELESAASRAFTYHSELVPGLLQAPDYQAAMFEQDLDSTEEYVKRQVHMRSQRQRAAFEKPAPLCLTAVIGQEALTRTVCGEHGMAEQREHLVKAGRQANIEVRVLPWVAGAQPAHKGAFNILQFDRDDDHPDVVYLETYVGGRYVEDEKMLRMFHRMFQAVSAMSVPIEEHLR